MEKVLGFDRPWPPVAALPAFGFQGSGEFFHATRALLIRLHRKDAGDRRGVRWERAAGLLGTHGAAGAQPVAIGGHAVRGRLALSAAGSHDF